MVANESDFKRFLSIFSASENASKRQEIELTPIKKGFNDESLKPSKTIGSTP